MILSDKPVNNSLKLFGLGGRYQNMSGGMFYRLAFTPTFSPYNQQLFFPMFGVSIGYTFKGS
ncbi:hypothetical protein [Membranihabitans maritimus]|uniref:hypothetical protein n=1 Tax=Membranihabitans maritimus TaxID=2904244 RepID=UPI001F32E350|nr:hypothetical protein [Membranihabitans maritimus]